MKKVFLVLVAVIGFAFAANAQNNLGVRLGTGSYGHGAEISWQHGMGSNNRLELDKKLDRSRKNQKPQGH